MIIFAIIMIMLLSSLTRSIFSPFGFGYYRRPMMYRRPMFGMHHHHHRPPMGGMHRGPRGPMHF